MNHSESLQTVPVKGHVDKGHVMVTGGGSGIGAATAKVFSDAGYRVTIVGRTESTLRAQDLPYQVCDVTDKGAVTAAFASAVKLQGPVTVVIANAGAAESVPFAKLTPEHVQGLLQVNVVGVINTWQAALSDMQTSGHGRLIAIASTAGLRGYPYVSAYSAAKHAVVGLTKSVALELAKTGVTTNAICPGFVNTPMVQSAIDNIVATTGRSAAEAADALIAGNPQKRLIEPVEVAESALWLASDAAASVNGHCLALSGGEV